MMKRLLFMVILWFAAGSATAQTLGLGSTHASVECGNNLTEGTFYRGAVGATFYYGQWTTSVGAAYSTARITAVDLRQNYAIGTMPGFTVGGRLLWRDLAAYSADDLATALFAGWHNDALVLELGWVGRFAGLREPLNLYYSATWLPLRTDRWIVLTGFSSYDEFIIERPHSPFFSLGCHYSPTDNLYLMATAVLHPAGMFNLAAQYYEAYLKLGVKYLW